MCGLAGLIHVDGSRATHDDEVAVRSMCDLLSRRGPDDQGVMAVGPACLGSRRLAIIDLSPAGHMPMSDPTGRWWIAYNGEIYNFHEIRAELEKHGAGFRSHSDTEVLLQAWIAWGAACLDRLVGMFAFAIFDSLQNELVLGRDRFGIKPLYWTRNNGKVLFASEMKAVLPQRNENRVDLQSLSEWWLYHNVDAVTPETLIEGVFQLMPGKLARIRDGGFRIETWYSPNAEVSAQESERLAALSEKEIIELVGRQLDEAVRLRLVSDVPVGTLLSGGLDSSLITAMAAGHSKHLTAFHISVKGHEDLDERRFAEALTAHHGIPFVTTDLTASSFRASLATVAWLEDLPITHANSVGYYQISQVARQHGTIVALTGEGADELFGGYGWKYRRSMIVNRLKPWLRRLPSKLRDAMSLLVYADSDLPVTAHRFRDLLPPAVGMLDRYARTDAEERCAEAYSFVRDPGQRKVCGTMLADLGDFLAPLLRRIDRTTMGASIEARVPFLDHRLVHTAINLPLDWRVGKRADKLVLKHLARTYMPGSLIWRKKMGFPLPLAEYIAPLVKPAFFAGGFCEETLHLGRRGLERWLNDLQRWPFGAFGLVSLELWGRMYLMDQAADTVAESIAAMETTARNRAMPSPSAGPPAPGG
jgi:asparagine synthase (glutamine-hydrolysing)